MVFAFIIIAQIASQQDQYNEEQYNAFRQMIDYSQQGEFAMAIEQYGQLEPEFADNYQAQIAVAYSYAGLNQLDQAQKYLDKARNDNRNILENPEYLALYGNILYLKKDYAGAEDYLNKCLQASPRDTTREQVKKILDSIENGGK